jgi:hypothetical protein
MQKRYIYSLLFGVPGFLVSLIISSLLVGASAGFLWIYVFGDNPWPASGEKMLSLVFLLIFLTSWVVFIVVGFVIGKNAEKDPALSTKHIMVSAAAVIVLIVLIVLYQLSVGNIGAKSDSILCAEFCSGKGYGGSGVTPKDSGDLRCSCFDEYGQEVMKVPMDGIGQDKKD